MPYRLRSILFRVLIPLGIVVAVVLLPTYSGSIDFDAYVTPVTLLFGILLGFFISTATVNYLDFQTQLSLEEGALIQLYNLGRVVQPSAKERLADAIDQYLITASEYSLVESFDRTKRDLDVILEIVDSLEPEDDSKRSVAALGYLHRAKGDLLKARKAVTFAEGRVTTWLHWVVIILLGGILAFLFSTLRDGLVSSLLVGFLVAALYLVLLLLYEVDNNLFLEEQLAYEDIQDVFRAIGRLEYYPDFVLRGGMAEAPSSDYRLGVYKNYPHSLEKEVRIVRVAR